MTRAQLLDSMTVAEFTEWWILYQREPWGESRMDILAGYHLAKLQNLITAMFTKKGSQIQLEKIQDNMLDWWGEIEKRTEEHSFKSFKHQLQAIDERLKKEDDQY